MSFDSAYTRRCYPAVFSPEFLNRGVQESKALVSNLVPCECCYCTINCAIVTRRGEAGFETLNCNAEMGTSGVKVISVDRLQQLDVMPPKAKKRKIQAGQLTLSFGHPTDQGAALQLSRPSPSSAHPEVEPPCNSDTEHASATPNVPQERRGDVASWRSFAESKWSSKHPWLVV